MSTRKLNVLIYAGPGTTHPSVHHATWSLRRLLGPNYACITITADQLLHEPWIPTCALLVFPGGADLGYCRALNGEGNRRIKLYVQQGGKYLGLCAGGYYGCGRCEFEVGREKEGMEVVGDRELGFFPGTCRGLAFGGFVYHSEAGARAAEVRIDKAALTTGGDGGEQMLPEVFRTYYNGGGVFVDAEKFKDKGVEVLARYTEELAVKSGDGEGAAAVVYCKVGEGAAVLTGPHPEFSAVNLNPAEPSGHHDYAPVVAALLADEQKRVDFMKACLTKLGLEVSRDTETVPSLSRLHLSSAQPSDIAELVHAWHEAGIIIEENGEQVIKGENDTFVLEQQRQVAGTLDVGDLKDALSSSNEKTEEEAEATTDKLLDYTTIPKRLLPHETLLPTTTEAPSFNHQAYFTALQSYNNTTHPSSFPQSSSDFVFGTPLLYGRTVTSTSTLLSQNPTWLSHLPTGFTATATTQVAGRGRGTNVWVSPPGSLMFSTVLRHSLALSSSASNGNGGAPVVFVQYLAALAVVEGVKRYNDRGGGGGKGGVGNYEKMPVRLKWPNDIYALDPTATASPSPSTKGGGGGVVGMQDTERSKYVKIGGILVQSSYSGGDYTLVVGIGLNVSNAAPTTSLNLLAAKLKLPQPAFTNEKLLASILTQLETLYTRFCRTGFDQQFEAMYYRAWLHSNQIVTLETEGGARARIKGISRDWGLLVAEELGREDRATGKMFQLQSDSNSFDFFRGLLKRKI